MSELEAIQNVISTVDNDQKREDCQAIFDLISEVTQEEPKLWRGQMIGFGTYEHVLSNGKTSEWFMTGFAPRKNEIVIYVVAGYERYDEQMQRLGKFKTGKSCLYIKTLTDIDVEVLREVIGNGYQFMKEKYAVK
jgi:hypothetical protein